MNSGIYFKSIFDVVDRETLEANVKWFGAREEELREQFSEMPQRATQFSAGYDLSCVNDYEIEPFSSVLIVFAESVSIENPLVTGVMVPRSSLAKKKGLIMLGGPQYIYCGTGHHCLAARFINFTENKVEVKTGDKIAQVVFIKCPSWISGEIDSSQSMVPDPLDSTVMSPLFENNVEFVGQDKQVDCLEMVDYNFQSPEDVILEPGKVTCIMTGLRVKMDRNQVFIIQNAFRSLCVELANCIGVIDSDYYDNPDNKGEIGVLLLNRGVYPVKVSVGDVIASGSIFYFAKCEGDVYGGQRTGGFGSTDGK